MAALANLQGIEGMIECRPDFREGRPHIAGTGVSIGHIVLLHLRDGLTPGEVADELGITRAQAHAALAFYFRNQEALDADLAMRDQEEAQIESALGRRREHRAG